MLITWDGMWKEALGQLQSAEAGSWLISACIVTGATNRKGGGGVV
jgi:hypothetical protein